MAIKTNGFQKLAQIVDVEPRYKILDIFLSIAQ